MAGQPEIRIAFIPAKEIENIVPLLRILGNNAVPEATIRERLQEMVQQNYECIGIYDGQKLIGTCGLWFQTRHYSGKNVEMDHIIIDGSYRGHGIGQQLVEFVTTYAREKSCRWIELNSYVHNFPSHKFFYNQGFVAKGYHFVKELD